MPEVYYRARALADAECAPATNGKISMLASTDDAVDFGGYREILVHGPDSIDTSAARSLLINHKPDLLAGSISGMSADGRQMVSAADIDADATMPSGVNVRKAVASGMLRGVSIGYTYSNKDATYDEATRTLTVKKWRLLEISLTPIPADGKAQIRSLPTEFITPAANNPAAERKDRSMSDEKKPQDTPAVDINEAGRAKEIAEARASRDLAVRITKLAESHGLRASDFVEHKTLEDAADAMIRAKAEKAPAAPKESLVVEVTRDQADKVRDAAVDGMAYAGGVIGTGDKDLGMRHLSFHSIVRRYAEANGVRTSDWSNLDLAQYVLGKPVMGARGAANVTSSNFNTVVLGNYADKAVFNGFRGFENATTYQLWTGRRTVADFKTFASGALNVGNLVSTSENVAFPELAKSEGSYTSALDLWGCTVSLTLQAIVNDDLGEFNNMLSKAGAIAQRTIDSQVYTTLNNATWTSNTTSSADLAASALDSVRAAFETKTGPNSIVFGHSPKYLLVPSCLRTTALQLTRQVQPGSEAYPTAIITHTDMTPIVTPYLTAAATKSQSSYYLAADPRICDTLTVAFLQGMESPVVMEYDAGAVAKRSWKIMMPFKPVLATTTISSTIYIPGMQQGTH